MTSSFVTPVISVGDEDAGREELLIPTDDATAEDTDTSGDDTHGVQEHRPVRRSYSWLLGPSLTLASVAGAVLLLRYAWSDIQSNKATPISVDGVQEEWMTLPRMAPVRGMLDMQKVVVPPKSEDESAFSSSSTGTIATSPTTTMPKSIGVKALYAEAEAIHHLTVVEAASAKIQSELARRDNVVADGLEDRMVSRQALIDSLEKRAEHLAQQGHIKLSKAEAMNNTALIQARTAKNMKKQADASIDGAKAMLNSSPGVTMIEELVDKQIQVANATKANADEQLAGAEASMVEAAAMRSAANEDLAISQAILDTAEKEQKFKRNTSSRFHEERLNAVNSTKEALEISHRKEHHKYVERRVIDDAKDSIYTVVKQDAIIERARQEVERAGVKALKAASMSAISKSDTFTASKRAAAAREVLRTLENQEDATEAMLDNSKGMKDDIAIRDIVAQEQTNEKKGEAVATEELDGAAALRNEAEALQQRAVKEAESAATMKKIAEEHEDAAHSIKAGIDSQGHVLKAGGSEVQALKDAAGQQSAIGQVMENAAKLEKAIVMEGSLQATAEMSEAQALLAPQFQHATPEAVNAVEEAAKEIQAAVETLKKELGSIRSEDPAWMREEATKSLDVAMARQGELMKAVSGRRVCVDLPGVQLKAKSAVADFKHLVGDSATGSHEQCKLKCRMHPRCVQVLYSWDHGCQLYETSTSQVVDFGNTYNASLCGNIEEHKNLITLLHQAYAHKPYIPPPMVCSWVGEDCSNTKCCNNRKCDWSRETCHGYTCYKKDAFSSGCVEDGSPVDPSWDGVVVGGNRPIREQGKAQQLWLTQGTSLFCFTAVMWHQPATKAYYDTEAALVSNWRKRGLGIIQCDENAIFTAEDAPVSESGAYYNAEAFMHIWGKVRQDGRYKFHDWVVKVDPDAVFFPFRLKEHLGELKTPKHARVYIENTGHKFHFMGALEVLTVEALDEYFKNAHMCWENLDHRVGEDFFMQSCLDSIGVDHQQDHELLRDKYASQNDCKDGWSAAFHYYKAVATWDQCYDQAVGAR